MSLSLKPVFTITTTQATPRGRSSLAVKQLTAIRWRVHTDIYSRLTAGGPTRVGDVVWQSAWVNVNRVFAVVMKMQN